ncbi:MAG: hypothetical protein KGM24_08230, partial [Elusimicrobia bacterium]|nr:hypothetical protein [Elusimicrobiota bacterium]
LAPALAALAVGAASRVAVGLLQDRLLGLRPSLLRALPLAVADVGALAFVAAAFRRTVGWRGKRYRLSLGGRAEVVG